MKGHQVLNLFDATLEIEGKMGRVFLRLEGFRANFATEKTRRLKEKPLFFAGAIRALAGNNRILHHREEK